MDSPIEIFNNEGICPLSIPVPLLDISLIFENEPQSLCQQYDNVSIDMQMTTPLQSIQDYQSIFTNFQEITFVNELSFCKNDIYVICKEILSSSLVIDTAVEWLSIDVHHPIRCDNNVYIFYHKETQKIYEVTCKLPEFHQCKQQQRELSKKDQKNINYCLTHLLKPKKHW